MVQVKSECMDIKQEPGAVIPPPSYQELNSVRTTSAHMQNPLLRNQLQSATVQQLQNKANRQMGYAIFSTCFWRHKTCIFGCCSASVEAG